MRGQPRRYGDTKCQFGVFVLALASCAPAVDDNNAPPHLSGKGENTEVRGSEANAWELGPLDDEGFSFLPVDDELAPLWLVANAFDGDTGKVRRWAMHSPISGTIFIDESGHIVQADLENADHDDMARSLDALATIFRTTEADLLREQLCTVGITLSNAACAWAQFEAASCAFHSEIQLEEPNNCGAVERVREQAECGHGLAPLILGCESSAWRKGELNERAWPSSKFDVCDFSTPSPSGTLLGTADSYPTDTAENTRVVVLNGSEPSCFHGSVRANTVTLLQPAVDVRLSTSAPVDACVLFRPGWLDPDIDLPFGIEEQIDCATEGEKPRKSSLLSGSDSAWAVGCCVNVTSDNPPPIRLYGLGSLPGLHKGDRRGGGEIPIDDKMVSGKVFVYVAAQDVVDETTPLNATVTLSVW